MTESNVRSRLHEALGEPDMPADLRHRTRLGLKQLADAHPARHQWIPGALAAGLAIAIVAGLVAVDVYRRSHSAPAIAGPTVECSELVSVGGAARGLNPTSNEVLLFINGSDSTCTIGAPSVLLIGDSGKALDVPQDWAPGAHQRLQLGPRQAAAVPYSISSLGCLVALRFGHVAATFSGGVTVPVTLAGELCAGSRITVSAPIPAHSCADGSFTWTSSNSPGFKPTC
jgi:hypothetical protein